MKESGNTVVNVTLSVTSISMTGLAVGLWWSDEAYLWKVTQTKGTLTTVRYQDQIFKVIVKPCIGAVIPCPASCGQSVETVQG